MASSASIRTPAAAQSGAGLAVPVLARTLVCLALGVGAVAGWLAAGPAAVAAAIAHAGPDLTRLLRGMAAIKTLMSVLVGGAILWALARPAPWPRVLAYAATALVLGAGPALIWNLALMIPGALATYAGLIAGVVLLGRDPSVASRLSATVTLKRGRTNLGA